MMSTRARDRVRAPVGVRRLVLAVLVAAGASACGMEFGGGDPDKGGGRRAVPPTVVSTAVVATGDVDELLEASGTVEARAAADLSPETTGRVTEVRVEVGDRVRKGEVLAVIRNETAQGGAARAADEVRHLKATLAELESLFGQGAVSAREVEDARYNLDQATLRLSEARATEADTRLVAPFAGVVAVRDVKVGEVASGGARAVQVVDPSELRVRARLPEQDLGRVSVGQTARLRSAYDDTQEARATVTRVAPVVDNTSGTFEVLLELDKDQQVLRPGQYVRISLVVDRREGVLVVPREAVRYEEGHAIAWRVEPAPPEEPSEDEASEQDAAADGEASAESAESSERPEDTGPELVAKRVRIGVGLVDEARAEVVDGLDAGDEIVTVGHASLRDGSRVRRPKREADGDGDGDATAARDDAADEDAG